MFQVRKDSFSAQRKWNAASQKWSSLSIQTVAMRSRKIKQGKRQSTVSFLFMKWRWWFWGYLPSSYFDALSEYAWMGGESERRAVTHRKFSQARLVAKSRVLSRVTTQPLLLRGWTTDISCSEGRIWAEATVTLYKCYTPYSPESSFYQFCASGTLQQW